MDAAKVKWTMFEPWPEESTSRRLENDDCDCDECGPASARKRRRHGRVPAAAPAKLQVATAQPPQPISTSPFHAPAEPSSAAEVPTSTCREPTADQGAAQDGSGPLPAQDGSRLATSPSNEGDSRGEVESAHLPADRSGEQQIPQAATERDLTEERKDKEDEPETLVEKAAG